jgi:hypothetical protein
MGQPNLRGLKGSLALAGAVALALAAAGCGKKGGVDDRARLDACVLTGATTNDGCDAAVLLGDLTMGAVKTRDVALYNGGAGAVAATVSAVALEGATAHFTVAKLFKLEGGLEVPVTLPYDLPVSHGGELRVRVAFTANVAVGPVGGASLRITASHPSTSVVLPITGQVTGCPAGRGDCDGDPSNGCEVDLQTSLEHCGACGTVAAPTSCGAVNGTAACTAGTCQIACANGFGNCDGNAANGCETDLLADTGHCGACGATCSTANGTPSCAAGACTIACAPGFAYCDGDPSNGCEVDLNSDAAHCGACGTSCGSVHGVGACSVGSCVLSCDAGFASCDGNAANGCETQIAVDTANCGACGAACSTAGGTASCTAGACHIACNPGFADCDGSAANGCEVNLDTSLTSCGTCGHACSTANATPACSAGACTIAACNAGFADCDHDPTNGCEANLNSSVASCGTCGHACTAANATPACSAGACAIAACNAGFADCDRSVANGCEIDTRSDLANCGACGHACGSANGSASCSGGTCQLQCTPGFADCNGVNADGCEVNMLFDPANCGACGLVCVTPNGTPSCSAAICTVAACNPGRADCNLLGGDGCEVDIASDPNNCGGCGIVCSVANGTPACVAGQCQVASCNAGFLDCNGNPADGCETNGSADPANCGTCGHACAVANGTAGCGAGVCTVVSCNAGFADCNGSAADGCEVATTSDVNNCGACGNACSPGPNVTAVACTSSACQIVGCSAGHYDVDGAFADGCECATAGTSASSAAPTFLGSLNIGQAVSFTGNLVPAGQEAWLVITFNGNVSATYHAKIALVAGASEYKFDLLSNCSGTAAGTCGEGGNSVGLTSWEAFYTAGDPTSYPVTGSNFNPIAPPGANGVVLVHVYRAAGVATTCSNYTLQLSN